MKKYLFILLLFWILGGCDINGIEDIKNTDIETSSYTNKSDDTSDKKFKLKKPKIDVDYNDKKKELYNQLESIVNTESSLYPNGKITLTGVLTNYNNAVGFTFLLLNKSEVTAYDIVAEVTLTKKSDNNIIFNKLLIEFSMEEFGELKPNEFFPSINIFPVEKLKYEDYGNTDDYELYVDIISSEIIK